MVRVSYLKHKVVSQLVLILVFSTSCSGPPYREIDINFPKDLFEGMEIRVDNLIRNLDWDEVILVTPYSNVDRILQDHRITNRKIQRILKNNSLNDSVVTFLWMKADMLKGISEIRRYPLDFASLVGEGQNGFLIKRTNQTMTLKNGSMEKGFSLWIKEN